MAERVQIELVVVDKTSAALGKTRVGIGKVNSSLSKTSGLAKAAVGALAAFGAVKMIKSIVNVGRSVEELGLRFKFLFGTAEEGSKAFDTLINFAGKVPFTLEEIQAGAGNLAVISKNAEELGTNLELVGNVAAVTGLDFRTTSEQIQRAFAGGIASADIFRERGVRALLGFKEGAKISVKETQEAFARVFGKGGRFGDATDEFAKTLTGTLSMMEDKLFKVKDAIAKGFFQELKLQLGDLNEFFDQNADAIEDFSRRTGEALGDLIVNVGKFSKFVKENFSELELIIGTLFAIWGRGIKMILGAAAVIDSFRREIKKLFIDQEQYNKALEDTVDMVEVFSKEDLAKIQKKWNDELKETNKELNKYPFYEDAIIGVVNATKKAEQAQRDYEESIKSSPIRKALHDITKEWSTIDEMTKLVTGAMETFRDTTASSIADVILEGKKLQEAIAEIGKAIVRHLIEGFIKMGIQIFVFEKIEKWLRSLKWAQADYNRELKITLALQAMLALFGGGGGIPFFQHGGRTAANQPIVVGEAGPEIFVPSGSGQIIPNNKIGGQEVSGGGDFMQPPVTVNFNIDTTDASGFDDLLLDRRSTIVGIINEAMNVRGREGVTS